MYDLEQSITERHSTRMFLARPVSRTFVEEPLGLAQHAPSNSNIPPWWTIFVSGAAPGRWKAVLLDAAWPGAPNIPAGVQPLQLIGLKGKVFSGCP